MSEPARGYSWPPFEPGNAVARRHGAFAADVEDAAVVLVDELLDVPSAQYLTDPVYRPSLRSWAVAEVRCRRLAAYVVEQGELDEDGAPRPALEALRTWETRASNERDRLGLSPLSRARLGRDVAAQNVDVARLWATAEAKIEEGKR